jgi:hypothetical protein
VLLVRRLKQLGHDKLAEWLSGTVFHQLGNDFNRTLLMDPLKHLAQTNETEDTVQETSTPTEVQDDDDDDEWMLLDTVCRILIMSFGSLIILIPAYFAWKYLRRKMKQRRKQVTKRSVEQLESARISDVERNGEHRVETFKLLSNTSSESEDDEIQFAQSRV